MTQTDTANGDANPPNKPIPITIVTGFLGAGKTTLILNLLPQLRALNPDYKLALLKNEFGDLAVDSQLAASSAIAGVTELLNGCICCNLVGQLGPALAELRAGGAAAAPASSTTGTEDNKPAAAVAYAPDRVIIETSGSAFPATLALEVNRLARETGGEYVLDGVVSVIDVENWAGYEDTSYTARLQARYTDLVVFNKWEECGERRFDEVLDRLGDLEVDVAWVKSERGWVDAGVVFGVDGGLARGLGEEDEASKCEHAGGGGGEGCGHDHDHGKGHDHHQSEVEVLSVELKGERAQSTAGVDAEKLMGLLKEAPKDEVYRIKAVLTVSGTVKNSDQDVAIPASSQLSNRYILNWAFGRWTFTPVAEGVAEHASSDQAVLRMTIILARYESTKWKKKLEAGGRLELDGADKGVLTVTKVN
ncbi:CobW/HypB/UreG, nucleotide-binding domain-containing protein [Dichotomopilus funicola]|uniref:CobW/HypB/UreG, nucleotide-binding domain-containing protein n=1 Tax=Dichotomopilus funicola TaxID=1934379 RepID=A0AAN6VBZ8_9PEZI|nr:CobW/HypB/UreG, nucleotide-binding domain-containing protein [Dichotomopilus funicola]